LQRRNYFLTCESTKDIKYNNKRGRFNSATAILGLIKRGKKGIIRIRKLSNGGNIMKERW
jgi:hypothetical protein